MSKQVLLVDDDVLLCRSLAYSLKSNGYTVEAVHSAEEALGKRKLYKPDIVLLDIGLPGMDGLDAVREFRSYCAVPIILVTARSRELDEIIGLEVGADDYITKPFNTDVLLAHIKSVLRRAISPSVNTPSQPIVVGDLQIDTLSHTITDEAKTISLSPKEYQLLLVLAQQMNRVFSIDELLRLVWGEEWIGESQTVYVHIRWLREKIERDPEHPRHLVTVRGAGYKFAS